MALKLRDIFSRVRGRPLHQHHAPVVEHATPGVLHQPVVKVPLLKGFLPFPGREKNPARTVKRITAAYPDYPYPALSGRRGDSGDSVEVAHNFSFWFFNLCLRHGNIRKAPEIRPHPCSIIILKLNTEQGPVKRPAYAPAFDG